MRILYVEDNPANLSLVERVARIGRHDVVTYMNGTTALENFERDRPDLVLMDIQLPGTLTGLDVVRKLRSEGHQLPIIAVTAYAMVGDRERCLAAGCDGYIAKPLPIADLVALFEKYAIQVNPLPPAVETKAEPQPPAAPDEKTLPIVFIPKPADTEPHSRIDSALGMPLPVPAEKPTAAETPPAAPQAEAKPEDNSAALPDQPPSASDKGEKDVL
jgi:CheY-like chemotaxis protein